MPVPGGGAFQRQLELLVRADPSALDGLSTAFRDNQEVFEKLAAAAAKGKITFDEFLTSTKNLAQQQTTLASAIQIAGGVIDQEMMKIGAEMRKRIDDYAALERAMEAETAKEIANSQAVAEAEGRIAVALINQDIARRNQANAIAGVTREIDHLNSVLAEGAQMEASAQRVDTTIVKSKKELADAAEVAANKSKGFAFAVLATSHALQDLQYGFAAVVNNIPTVVYGIGSAVGATSTQIAAWGGGLMALGVAAQIASPHIAQMAKDIGLVRDPANEAAVTLDELKAKLKALEARPSKVAVDYSQIDEATRRIQEIEKKLAVLKGLSGRSDLEEKAGKIISDAINESGGQEKIVAAVSEVEKRQGTFFNRAPKFPELQAAQAEQASNERMLSTGGLPAEAVQGIVARQAQLERKIATLTREVELEARANVQSTVADAALGKESARSKLLDQVSGMPDVFSARGVGPEFAAGLFGASPDIIRGQEENERQVARQQRAARLDAELARKREKDAKDQERAHAKEVEDTQFLRNLEDVESEAHATKYFAGEAKSEKDNASNARKVQAAAEKTRKSLERQVKAEERLLGREVKAEEKQFKAQNKVLENQAYVAQFSAEGLPDNAALFASEQTAGLVKNKHMDPNAAMQQVFGAVVKSLALQEQSNGMIGYWSMRAMAIEQRQQQLQQQVRWLSGQTQRGRNQRPSLLPTIGN